MCNDKSTTVTPIIGVEPFDTADDTIEHWARNTHRTGIKTQKAQREICRWQSKRFRRRTVCRLSQRGMANRRFSIWLNHICWLMQISRLYPFSHNSIRLYDATNGISNARSTFSTLSNAGADADGGWIMSIQIRMTSTKLEAGAGAETLDNYRA